MKIVTVLHQDQLMYMYTPPRFPGKSFLFQFLSTCWGVWGGVTYRWIKFILLLSQGIVIGISVFNALAKESLGAFLSFLSHTHSSYQELEIVKSLAQQTDITGKIFGLLNILKWGKAILQTLSVHLSSSSGVKRRKFNTRKTQKNILSSSDISCFTYQNKRQEGGKERRNLTGLMKTSKI